MTWNKTNTVNEPSGDWGGAWTERKLTAFSKYVKSYLIIMKKNPYWETIYFDGFAGSGSRSKQKNEIFKQLNLTEAESSYKGAAERVLNIANELSFDYYYFIDKDEKSLSKLKEKLTNKYPDKTLEFRAGDANIQIENLATALHSKKYSSLVFLDPFGMQINWSSIEKLRDTRSDLWILVPTGVIVNRLLDKAGKLKFSSKLEDFFGLSIDEIKEYFYRKQKVQTLFGEEEIITKVSEPIEKIARLYIEQMKTIWKYVTENPLVLTNRNGVPIFHFVFASNNKSAVKIANQIIQKV